MNSITDVQKDKAANATTTSYTIKPTGDVVISWAPADARRRSKTLTGFEAEAFTAHLDKYRTKTGKIPARVSHNAILDILAPAPVFKVGTTNGDPVSVTKIREGFLTFSRDIPSRKRAPFAAEYTRIKTLAEKKPRVAERELAALCEPLF
jgi:hypothetical protein